MRLPSFMGLLLLLGGCEPVFAVEGNAQTMPACPARGADPYAGAAAASANVLLHCPSEPDKRLGQLDVNGHMHYQAVGYVATSCTVSVEKDGYWPVTLPLGDVCVFGEGDRCHLVSFAVDLYPKAVAPTSDTTGP